MNWITKILSEARFKSPEEHVLKGLDDPIVTPGQPTIPRDIFVDDAPPQTQAGTLDNGLNDSSLPQQGTELPETLLKQFLDRDYSSKGYRDGYETHSTDTLEINLKKLRAEFRLVIDEVIDDKAREVFTLRTQLINAGGVSERLRDHLQLRIEELQRQTKILEAQKELSVEDEGYVSVIIHKYQDGFIRGVQAFEQDKVLASTTGLFR